MNKLFTLIVVGSMASLSADYYNGGSYATCPNCPGGGGYYQEGNYQGGSYNQGSYNQGSYNQGGYNQGNVQGYYQDGSAPRLVGTRPGRTGDGGNIAPSYAVESRSNDSTNNTWMNRTTTTTTANTANTEDLNKRVQGTLSGGWFSRGYQNVTFEANNGNVVLRGTVDSLENKNKVEDAVRKLDGVRSVTNQITVAPDNKNMTYSSRTDTTNGSRTDTANDNRTEKNYPQDSAATQEDRQLNTRIRDQIKGGWFSKEYDTLILRTSNGIVVISGAVDSQEDADKIHEKVKKIEGVRSVNNQLTVKNPNNK